MALIDDIHALLPDNDVGAISEQDLRDVFSMMVVDPQFVGPEGPEGPEGPPGAGGNPLDAWPVGSVFIGVVTTSPATLLGGGTWARVAEGRMLISQAAGDADFDTARETGGAKTHQLTAAQSGLPAHTHTISGGSSDDTSAPFTGPDASTSTATAFGGGIGTVSAAGAAEAHPIMNPYFVVYMWERTA